LHFEIEAWKFTKPVYIGDTLKVELEVLDTKPLPRLGGGMITIQVDMLNQRDESVMKGKWSVLVASKPAS
jgi:acyl dehydratase